MRITRDQVDGRHHGWTILTAHCTVCDGQFTALTQRQGDPGVHHRCGTGVIGPVWTTVQPVVQSVVQSAAAPAAVGLQAAS